MRSDWDEAAASSASSRTASSNNLELAEWSDLALRRHTVWEMYLLVLIREILMSVNGEDEVIGRIDAENNMGVYRQAVSAFKAWPLDHADRGVCLLLDQRWE